MHAYVFVCACAHCVCVCVCMCMNVYVCVCVCERMFPCSLLQAFQFLDQFTGLHETWYERYTFEGHCIVAVFNFVQSAIPDLLILGTEIMYSSRSLLKVQLFEVIFCKM